MRFHAPITAAAGLLFSLSACSGPAEPDAGTAQMPEESPATAPADVDEAAQADASIGVGEDQKTPAEAPSGSSPAPVAAASPAPSVAPAAPAAPPMAFMQCRGCHSIVPGDNRIGPSLTGIYGRKAASVQGFSYSTALKDSGITWDRASLDTWLTSPMKMVPGTRMVIGVSDPAKRKEIIDYLETLK